MKQMKPGKPLWTLAASGAVMFLLPWLAVVLAPSDAGMSVMFLLLFGVFPMFMAVVGVLASHKPKKRWWTPVIPAAVFLAAMVLLFDDNAAFAGYAGVYLLVGFAAMGLALGLRGVMGKLSPRGQNK